MSEIEGTDTRSQLIDHHLPRSDNHDSAFVQCWRDGVAGQVVQGSGESTSMS